MFSDSIIRGVLYSTSKEKLDVNYIHTFLKTSYWAENIPLDVVTSSIENSLSIGIYDHSAQVGFARLITDYATFAYLADVFVDETHRGRGLSKGLMEYIFSMEFPSGLRRMLLATRDAHSLYAQYGFLPLERPESYMEIKRTDVYKSKPTQHDHLPA